ncbi:MAG: hypothetical protein IPK32_17670 [Verrucomicrobiaceae bacterium]|nr:hypothetical protein [Verrucomicrobiaceae bacterium]
MPLTLDICTFDPGSGAKSPAAYAAEVTECVETAWDSGADMVLLPEFTWMGLEPLVEPPTPAGVARVFWGEIYPTLCSLLRRPGKGVVLGTAPFWDADRAALKNRAPILLDESDLYQDKLHLTPWESIFTPGDALRLFDFGGVRFAVVICLDIEIAEISAQLRGRGVDVVLVPSATETLLGVERVDRCASARAVELGCITAVSHLTGGAPSQLIDENVGRAAVYFPSQSPFGHEPRWIEGPIISQGLQKQRVIIDKHALDHMRRLTAETNPSLLARTGDFTVIDVGE